MGIDLIIKIAGVGILSSVVSQILKNLGIEKCCFMGDKLGIIINPFVFLPVLQKNIQGRKL